MRLGEISMLGRISTLGEILTLGEISTSNLNSPGNSETPLRAPEGLSSCSMDGLRAPTERLGNFYPRECCRVGEF